MRWAKLVHAILGGLDHEGSIPEELFLSLSQRIEREPLQFLLLPNSGNFPAQILPSEDYYSGTLLAPLFPAKFRLIEIGFAYGGRSEIITPKSWWTPKKRIIGSLEEANQG